MPAIANPKNSLNPLEIRKDLSLSQERLANLLRVSAKTIARWEKESRQPTDTVVLERLAKLKEIAAIATMVYTPKGIEEFLLTPLPVFNGRSALDMMQLGDFQPVIAALAADFEGTGF